MSMSIYVGHLSDEVTSGELAEAFAKFGTVTRAQVVADRATGRSRGFGFVAMSEGGERAIAGLNGSHFHGQALAVSESRPRRDGLRGGYSRHRAAYRSGSYRTSY
jgi:RNA recognition motif-containing protein